MGFWAWLTGRPPAPVLPAPERLEQDVFVNLQTESIDLRWRLGGVEVFGVRMTAPEAQDYVRRISLAINALATAPLPDLAVEIEDE